MSLFHIWLIGVVFISIVGIGIVFSDFEQDKKRFEADDAMAFAQSGVILTLLTAMIWPAALGIAAVSGAFYSIVRWVLFPLYGLLFDGARATRKAFKEAGP